jgi:hypothetical protein
MEIQIVFNLIFRSLVIGLCGYVDNNFKHIYKKLNPEMLIVLWKTQRIETIS